MSGGFNFFSGDVFIKSSSSSSHGITSSAWVSTEGVGSGVEGVGDWRPFVILPLNALLAAVPPNCCISGSCSLTLRRCFVRWINETGLRIVKSRGNLRGGEPHFLSVLRFGGLVFIGDRAGMGEVCERDIVVN